MKNREKFTRSPRGGILLLLWAIILISQTGCEQEDYDMKSKFERNKLFFAHDGQVPFVESVIDFLQAKNDSANFVSLFIEKYGYPVWDKALLAEDDKTLLFVPVKSNKEQEIETIWLFKASKGWIEYYVVSKERVREEDKWIFDYFTQEVLKKRPVSGLVIKHIDDSSPLTRTIIRVTNCLEVWIGKEDDLTYAYTTCSTTTYFINDYLPEDGLGGGHDPSNIDPDCGGGGGNAPDPEESQEVIMDKSFKDTKAECIFQKLSELSGGFKKAIQKFDGEFPVSHLKFSLSYDLPSTSNGKAYPPEKYVTKIAINGNNLNRPNLAIAKTIIHETIHAEMFRKMLSAVQKGDLKPENWTQEESERFLKNLQNNFPGIYDFYYKNYKKHWDHEQMAGYYRGYIVDLLKQFDPSQPDGLYEALAWEGLKQTDAWDRLSQAKKDKINNLLRDFNKRGGEPCL